jgi:uncharacterized protein
MTQEDSDITSDTETAGTCATEKSVAVRIVNSLKQIDATTFDAYANPDPRRFNPFVTHAFLEALETAGCVSAETGWLPHHLVLEDADGGIAGIMPAYLKSHSQGEFVFDYGWADAYERAGGDYYPKLQVSVPFTPVPGPRVLVRQDEDAEKSERLLAAAAVEVAKRHGLSSFHITFVDEAAWRRLGDFGLLQRTDQQFHFANPGYASFQEFLDTLTSRKRKALRKERAQALEAGIEIEHVTGSDITEAHWDAFYRFYVDTGSRKWGDPYLNREFFSELGQRMADACLLVFARRGGRYIAGALNLIGGDCLYGRYWGAIEHHPFLHFEICYYQSIEYAITHGLPRVEAGAQGEHKLARGYVPETTYSLHWFADRRLWDAVERFLTVERHHVERTKNVLRDFAPFKRDQGQAGGD